MHDQPPGKIQGFLRDVLPELVKLPHKPGDNSNHGHGDTEGRVGDNGNHVFLL